MKVVYQVTVTDEDVKRDVLDMVDEMEEDGWIEFPSDDACDEFVAECTQLICDKCEDEYFSTPPGRDDYWNEVIDLAKTYGYTTED